VIFSAEESYDFDDDKLKYEWSFTDETVQDRTAFPRFTFEKPGIYQVRLKVTDPNGETSIAKQEIQVGNEPPEVAWELAGNQTFYWDNRNLIYNVKVKDIEDENSTERINPKDIQVSFDYLPEGFDITTIAQGHQNADQASTKPKGLQLIESSDCKSCHALNKKINGPSYQEIASRYRSDDFATRNLSQRIIEGTSGNWGNTAMAAHPQLTTEQATEMVLYILSLGTKKETQSDFLPFGEYVTKTHIDEKNKGLYLLMASYTDKGNGVIKPITQQSQIFLKYHRIDATEYGEGSSEFEKKNGFVSKIFNNDYLVYKNIDLTDINDITLNCGLKSEQEIGGKIEIRLDSADGILLGETEFAASEKKAIQITPQNSTHNIYLVFKSIADPNKPIVSLNWIEFNTEKEML
jgi:cytochrome c